MYPNLPLMLRPDSPLLPDFSKGFGEIYFSEVLPGHVKAWKRHTCQTQHFAVPSGLLKIVLYDDRPDSATRGVLCELALGRPEHYGLLRIPVNVWYGFTAMAYLSHRAKQAASPGTGRGAQVRQSDGKGGRSARGRLLSARGGCGRRGCAAEVMFIQ